MDYKPTKLGDNEVTIFSDTGEISACHRGWVAGPYVLGMENLPFEVKDATHQKGDERAEWSNPGPGYCWVWVLEGELELHLRLKNSEEAVVLKPGSAVVFANAVPHRWYVNCDQTRILTVRSSRE